MLTNLEALKGWVDIIRADRFSAAFELLNAVLEHIEVSFAPLNSKKHESGVKSELQFKFIYMPPIAEVYVVFVGELIVITMAEYTTEIIIAKKIRLSKPSLGCNTVTLFDFIFASTYWLLMLLVTVRVT